MTDEVTIIAAAEAHFEALASRPDTIWPNQNGEGNLPRLEFDQGPVNGRPFSLKGVTQTSFLFQVVVVSESGSRSAENRALAQQVIDHFKVGTKISTATVRKRPELGAPYPGQNEWRQPITISLRAHLAA